MDAATAQAQAKRLRQKARGHKRKAAAERKAAREAMQRLAALQTMCREHGIDLILEEQPTPTEPRRQSGTTQSIRPRR